MSTPAVGDEPDLYRQHAELVDDFDAPDDRTRSGYCFVAVGDVVFMSAELELAAWSTNGEKLWTMFVEPPWSYEVTDSDEVRLDMMGTITTFDKRQGPHG